MSGISSNWNQIWSEFVLGLGKKLLAGSWLWGLDYRSFPMESILALEIAAMDIFVIQTLPYTSLSYQKVELIFRNRAEKTDLNRRPSVPKTLGRPLEPSQCPLDSSHLVDIRDWQNHILTRRRERPSENVSVSVSVSRYRSEEWDT